MKYQIRKVLWPIIMKLCTTKVLWILLFIILLTTILLMYSYSKREIKRDLLHEEKDIVTNAVKENVHEKLQSLAENITLKEDILKRSRSDLMCAEKVLNFIESNKISSINRYKNLLHGLKSDLAKMESEVKNLQDEIKGLTKQRETIKTDMSQENYRKVTYTFTQ